METELLYWVWLSQCFSPGSERPSGILGMCSDVRAFYEGGQALWSTIPFLGSQDFKRMRCASLERCEEILRECREKKIRIITWADAEYPQRLRVIFGPPVALYCKGSLKGLDEQLVIAAVGTRKAAPYTKRTIETLCRQLACAGVLITSGCAVGIDEHALKGAMSGGGRTIGVLSCGLDVDYPAATRELREDILASGGALISELPPGKGVDPGYIPVRNRLMAGLALGVLVAQAPERSGALITADLGIEQGKEVFALPPYDIFDSACAGVIPLLRDGVKPVYNVSDILEEYYAIYSDRIDLKALREAPLAHSLQASAQPVRHSASREERKKAPKQREEKEQQAAKPLPPLPVPELTEPQKRMWNALEREPKRAEDLVRESGLSLSEALAVLTALELLGLAVAHPGRRYGRNPDRN